MFDTSTEEIRDPWIDENCPPKSSDPHWPQSDIIDEDFAFEIQKEEIRIVEVEHLDKTKGEKRKREEDGGLSTEAPTKCEKPSASKKFQYTSEEETKINFFKSRVTDFKTFIERRVPPDNKTAQEYLKEFLLTSDKAFANELVTSVSKLQMIGGLELIFGRMCSKANMQAEDFIDRSLERPDLKSEKQKKDQLTFEIVDYHTQIKELMKLAKQLPNSFFS